MYEFVHKNPAFCLKIMESTSENQNLTNRNSNWPVYSGIALTACVILMYEILLTRIFSVTMWYHFAFMAISIAMFGMTVGTMLVYILSNRFPPERTKAQMASYSLAFAITIVFAVLAFALVPPLVSKLDAGAAWTIFLIISYPLLALPFIPSGIVIALALTKLEGKIGRLYASDLSGAAFGCPGIIILLSFTDAMSSIVVLAAFASLAAALFAHAAAQVRIKTLATVACITFTLFAVAHTIMVRSHHPLISLSLIKGAREAPPLYERWNSFSRVVINGNEDLRRPEGWGLSPLLPKDMRTEQLRLVIDGSAATVLTKFGGDLSKVEHLKYDITALAHWIRHDGHVLVVGIGGGRDILTALAFKQNKVTGIEINNNIINALTGVYGDFTGHLDRIPNVRIINDEARSYVASSGDRFDIIQVSLIDTFAATQAGALALTENSLYTTECWRLLFDHLTSGGLLSFSRWHTKELPSETYRLVSLANTSLLQSGIKEPRKHIMIAVLPKSEAIGGRGGVSTILVSKSPFSTSDVTTIRAECARMGFDVILDPDHCTDPRLSDLCSGEQAANILARLPEDLTAPTDDRPFFFQTTRVADSIRLLFHPDQWFLSCISFHVRELFVILVVAFVLNAVFILLPLVLVARKPSLAKSGTLLVHFLSIGLGFMLLEIAQMQRLSIFLGAPVLSLAVVLFTLLLSGGAGSFHTALGTPLRAARLRLALLLLIVIATGFLTPTLLNEFSGVNLMGRIAVAICLVSPMGFVLGMAFPLGIQLAHKKGLDDLLPWFWGLNGSASVLSSVLSTFLLLYYGISATYFAGAACYVLAIIAFVISERASKLEP